MALHKTEENTTVSTFF